MTPKGGSSKMSRTSTHCSKLERLDDMDELLVTRLPDGRLSMIGVGIVRLGFNYQHVLGRGGQGVVFGGKIFRVCGEREVLEVEVALKVNAVVDDPLDELQREAELHVQAFSGLHNVLRPLGFLKAHAPTGTPAVLIMEVAKPMAVFLAQCGPLLYRNLEGSRAISRIMNQLLRLIVAGDAMNFMHKDIKLENVFVRNADNLQLAELALGDFGGAQNGRDADGHEVSYRPGIYTWKQTSPRMAAFIYRTMAEEGIPFRDIELSRQLTFYNDLFGWARVAFVALADRSPPDILYGPSSQDYMRVPVFGHSDVQNAVRHLTCFALDVLTVGSVEDILTNDFVTSLHWYDELPRILAGSSTASEDNRRHAEVVSF